MKNKTTDLEQKLEAAIGLLQHLLALELAREGVPSKSSPNIFVWQKRASE